MLRAVVRGELRAYFLAAEFVKECRLLAGVKTPRARLYYSKQEEVIWRLVEVCVAVTRVAVKFSYYLCGELCRWKVFVEISETRLV